MKNVLKVGSIAWFNNKFILASKKEKGMKKLALVTVILLCAGVSHAISFNEKPVYDVSVATTVSISTSAWTKVPTDSNTVGRLGINVSNPASNNAVIVGVVSTSTSTPTEATTVRPIEIQTGENPFIKISRGLYLYLLSLHTAAENVHLQEYLSR